MIPQPTPHEMHRARAILDYIKIRGRAVTPNQRRLIEDIAECVLAMLLAEPDQARGIE
jgi:hypothetical protein